MKLLSLTLAICIYVTTAAPAASDVVVPEAPQQTRGFFALTCVLRRRALSRSLPSTPTPPRRPSTPSKRCWQKGLTPQKCDVGSPPEVTKRTLAAGVDESACVGGASTASTGELGFAGAAANGYQLPGETLPQGYGWYGAPRVGMTCCELCASGGKTFDAPHTQQTGTKACKFFHPTFAVQHNWETIGCGANDQNPMTCFGANGGTPVGTWKHAACYVQCVCKA